VRREACRTSTESVPVSEQPIVPSFVAKLNRAEKHLVDLKDAIERFGGSDPASRPYTVRARIESKKKPKVHRLYFTRSILNTDVPLIAADAIYSLRSSMEHLMGALVASKDRDSVTFPVFFRGVWEPPIPGENQQRLKDRQRWATVARAVHADALAFLKQTQPPDDAPTAQTPHALRLLNQLSNNDRHTKLPLVAHGVQGLLIRWRLPSGDTGTTAGIPSPGHLLEDHAEIRNVPNGAVYVESYGTPEIVIRTALTNAHGRINLPVIDFVSDTLDLLRGTVIPGLTPYVRVAGKQR
jgi:hypothetical protein